MSNYDNFETSEVVFSSKTQTRAIPQSLNKVITNSSTAIAEQMDMGCMCSLWLEQI